MDVKHYVEKYKEHEARRATTNEREEYWRHYAKSQKHLDPETSFDMGKYA